MSPNPCKSPPPSSPARVFVYAGPHYGRPHFILARHAHGRELRVKHLDGKPFTVHLCDTETVEATSSGRAGSNECGF